MPLKYQGKYLILALYMSPGQVKQTAGTLSRQERAQASVRIKKEKLIKNTAEQLCSSGNAFIIVSYVLFKIYSNCLTTTMTTEWLSGMLNILRTKTLIEVFPSNVQRPVIFQLGSCLEYNWQSILYHVPSVETWCNHNLLFLFSVLSVKTRYKLVSFQQLQNSRCVSSCPGLVEINPVPAETTCKESWNIRPWKQKGIWPETNTRILPH